MEIKISLTVPGEPQGKQRAKWAKVGMYTPKETVNYEAYVKSLFAVKYPDFTPLEGGLTMKLTAWVSIPESASGRRKKLMRANVIKATKKPDMDNVHKIVCDALEKMAYRNDNQFVSAIISKLYSDRPRLEISIGKAG